MKIHRVILEGDSMCYVIIDAERGNGVIELEKAIALYNKYVKHETLLTENAPPLRSALAVRYSPHC